MTTLRWPANPWLYGATLGVVLGTILLGVGGRLMMRVIALVDGTPVGWSWGGSATVVFLGAASGLGAGIGYSILAHFLPRATRARTVIAFVLLVLGMLRGLSPVRPLALALFLPLTLIFGAVLDLSWRVWARNSGRDSAIGTGDSAAAADS